MKIQLKRFACVTRDWLTGVEIYFKEYPRYILALVLLFSAFICSIIWLVCAESGADRWNPIVVILTIGAAYLIGSHLPIPISDLRSRHPQPSLEDSEDRTTEPWRAVNHSFAHIRWKQEVSTEHRKAIERYIRGEFSCVMRSTDYILNLIFPRNVSVLAEYTGTLNYRVLSIYDRPRLVRIHVADNTLDLDLRYKVLDHIRKSAIFKTEYTRAITPCIVRDTGTTERKYYAKRYDEVFSPGRSVLFEIYPYLCNVHHFSGEKHELESVAHKMGELQRHMTGFVMPGYIKHNCMQRGNKQVHRPYEASGIEYLWKRIENEIKKIRSDNDFVNIIDKNIGNIEKWIKDISKLRNTRHNEKRKVLLFDMHPHNVFCNKDGKCELIYDYSWADQWYHSRVLAFTIHRFVREFVRKKIEEASVLGDKDVENWVNEGTRGFLVEYQRGWGEKLQDGDFPESVGRYIRCANMDKLLDTFLKGFGLEEDPSRRPETRIIGEARKFVRYMKESERFDNMVMR